MTCVRCGEEAGVALEVARVVERHRVRRAPGPWRRLSSCAASRYRTMDSSSTSSRGSGSPPPSASARSCPRCSPARSPPPTSASTSTAPTSRSSSRRSFLLAVVVALAARRRARRAPARGPEPAARRRAGRRRIGARRAAVGAARWPTSGARLVARAWSRGLACAALGQRAPRATVRPRRAPARRRGARARCPSTPRAPRSCSRACAVLFPPSALLVIGVPRRGCSPAAAGARARSTRACASCGERRAPSAGRASSSSRSSTP